MSVAYYSRAATKEFWSEHWLGAASARRWAWPSRRPSPSSSCTPYQPRASRSDDRMRRAGGAFYQFAFSGRGIHRVIEWHDFTMLSATPYDPGRIVRQVWRRLRRSVCAGVSADPSRRQEAVSGDVSPPLPAALGALRWLLGLDRLPAVRRSPFLSSFTPGFLLVAERA